MKRLFLFIAVSVISLPLFGQDDESRALSKYANDQFREDDVYTVTNPYQTITVAQPPLEGEIKNVIYMIGDGMGFEQVSCGWVLNGGHLNLDNCLFTGISRTYALNALITDSCAGGAALATGHKTNYGYIAVDADKNPVESVLEYARGFGMKSGVAVTCRINDATPADFVCHTAERDLQAEIAAQYVDSGVDFIAGGGIKFWQNREDGRDLVKEMQQKGYTFVDDINSLTKVEKSPVLGLFAPTEMAPALDRGPILEECAKKAIEVLDNEKGFFLMIEGSCIDDWAHRQKVGYMAEELFDFDRTIGHVLEWAAKDGHTLVVITADHATGGLTMTKGSLEERSVKVHFSTKGHNGIFVPVFAFGPGADKFVGVHENADIANIIKSLIGRDRD